MPMDRGDPAYAGQSDYTGPMLTGVVPSTTLDDSEEGLRQILEEPFERVELDTIGSVAVFTARDPRIASPA